MKIKPRLNPEASGPANPSRKSTHRARTRSGRSLAQAISIPLVATVGCGDPAPPTPTTLSQAATTQTGVTPWKQIGTNLNGPVFLAGDLPALSPFDDISFTSDGVKIVPRPPKVILEHYRQEIDQDSRSPWPYIMLLNYYKTEEGAKHKDDIQEIFQYGFDTYSSPIAAYALCDFGARDPAETEDFFRLKRDKNPYDPYGWYDYAHFVDASGNKAKAIEILKEAMRIVPLPMSRDMKEMRGIFDLYKLLLGMNPDHEDNYRTLDEGIQRSKAGGSEFRKILEAILQQYKTTFGRRPATSLPKRLDDSIM